VAMADVVTIFEQSKALCRTVIDFDDMIYAPLAFNARFFQVDWVMIDECQDINPARRELARRMLKPGGRLVAVGDSRQAIYGFTGAGADALERIVIEFGCKRLPLTVTYRCPKAVVAYVQQWVKHIEAHESAPEGCVRAPMLDKVGEGLPKPRPWFESEGLRAGDAVLCRYTLPLIKQAYNMLRAGRACKVEGREIGKGLENLATRWKVKSLDVLENRLAKFLAKEVAKAKAADNERAAEEIRDRVASLQVFIERTRTNGHNTIEELVLEIQALFADDVKGVPVLCTGHKSKGREWHRVYWMQTTLRQKNLQDWQLVQEANLKYVMATRAKSELILLPEGM
jgi:DNA helicase-2/ATP-dependent DNA helicase PcrA